VAILVLVLLLGGVLALRAATGGTRAEAAGTTTSSSTTTTTVADVTTTTAPPPPPTTTTVPAPPPTLQAAAAPVRDLGVYTGLGTWIDVYDWSETYNRYGDARVGPEDVDRMAASGVQTLYVQTGKWDAPTQVLEQDRLQSIIDRAEARGIAVVAWYLPTFENPQEDMARLMAATRLRGVDALAVDIESLKFRDVAERNRRLVEISTNLRAALPNVALGAIPYPPVVTDVINPNLWPNFPWQALAPLYDVWLPMSYQSDRKPESGYRDAYRYLAENIDRMRARLGRPDVPVHAIGGIADRTSPEDVAGLLRASVERRALGGSLYDWHTTPASLWPALGAFRR
jgi:hypothetical protein